MVSHTSHSVWGRKEMQVYTQLRARAAAWQAKSQGRALKNNLHCGRQGQFSSRQREREHSWDWHLKARERWVVSWEKQGQNENEEVEEESVGETDKTV